MIDFLKWADDNDYIAGTFYFSPKFYLFYWALMSLFTYLGRVKPAIDAFNEY